MKKEYSGENLSMKREKKYGSRMLAKGVIVSNNTFETGMNNNDLIFGPSGCGKTGGYVVPMLQNPSESLVVVDTKNNLSKMFTDSLQRKGYTVHLIDLVKPKNSTSGYNPLAYVRNDNGPGFDEKKLKSLAYNFVPEYDVSEPIWSASVRKYFALLFCYVLTRLPKGQQNLQSVIRLHSEVSQDPKRMRQFMERELEELSNAGKKRKSMLENLMGQVFSTVTAEKMWASIMDMVGTTLSSYDTSELQYVFSKRKTLDISGIGREKTVVFLNISDMDRSCDGILNLFYIQLFQELGAEAARNSDCRLTVPVRILMDDFASGAKIEAFDRIISVVRSRDIYVSLIVQSLSQLESLYGEGQAKTILNNCDHLLYMGGNDERTLQYVANRVNKSVFAVASKPRKMVYLMTSGEPARLVPKTPPYSTQEEDSEGAEQQMSPAL